MISFNSKGGIKITAYRYIKYFLVGSLWVLAFSLLLLQVFYTRFMQDDYIQLGYVSNHSLIDFLKVIWTSQGGNLWVYGFQGLLLTKSLYSVNVFFISAWTFVTISAVTVANYQIMRWFMGKDLSLLGKFKLLSIFSVSYLGFEGLFTPGLIAAFSFHQAAFSHLWPITLLIISLNFMKSNNKNLLLAFGLGLLIGNSNASESFASILCLFLILFLRNNNLIVKSNFFKYGFRFYYALLSGTLTGFLIIIAAPGFWNRAQNSVGFPDNGHELLNRFLKSIGSFSADLVTHPMVWIAFMIGTLIAIPEKQGQDKLDVVAKIRLLLCLGFILFISLTIGSTFAYVSWHQSTGLYQIFIPLTFLLGVYSKSVFGHELGRAQKSLLVLVVAFSLALMSARAGILIRERSADWDAAFKVNYCLIKENPNSKLVGAEMLYPGFNLGIEDVSTWEWMRDGYSNWVSNPKFKSEIKC